MSDELKVIDGGSGQARAVLKSLDLVGFKSFVHKTHLEFAPGITAIIGPNGSGKCVAGSSRVTLGDGSERMIRELVDEALAQGPVQIMDDGFATAANPGRVAVMTLDPETLRLESRPVSAFVKRRAPPTLIRIRTRSGRNVMATACHPLFTLLKGSFSAIRAEDIRSGAYVALPRELPVEGDRAALPFAKTLESFHHEDRAYVPSTAGIDRWLRSEHEAFGSWNALWAAAGIPESRGRGIQARQSIAASDLVLVGRATQSGPELEPILKASRQRGQTRIPEVLTPQLARFLGYLIAEGNNGPPVGSVVFTNSDPQVLGAYQTLAEELFGLRPYRRAFDRHEKVYLFSRALALLLERRFEYPRLSTSADKEVPGVIFSAPERVQWEFLSGLFEGDAHLSFRQHAARRLCYIEYSTASRRLAEGVVGVLLRLGVFGMLREVTKRATNAPAHLGDTYYSVFIYGSEQIRYAASQLRFVGAKHATAVRLRAYETKSNPNLDLVPGAVDLVRDAARLAHVSVKRHRKGRSKLAAYTERRCEASRGGLLEVAAQIEELGADRQAAASILERLRTLAQSDIYWDTVVSVEEIVVDDEWVYDLCVDQTHNFVADNVIVHNSNVADAIRWALGENNARILRAK